MFYCLTNNFLVQNKYFAQCHVDICLDILRDYLEGRYYMYVSYYIGISASGNHLICWFNLSRQLYIFGQLDFRTDRGWVFVNCGRLGDAVIRIVVFLLLADVRALGADSTAAQVNVCIHSLIRDDDYNLLINKSDKLCLICIFFKKAKT